MPQAIPGQTSSSPPVASQRAPGFLRVVSPGELDQQDAAAAAQQRRVNSPPPPDDLNKYVRNRWHMFRNHRNTGNNPLNQRLLRSQRVFEGQYDPDKRMEILKFGGSVVYSRLVAVKCRGATSLLRDVYLGGQRPWTIQSQPDPPVPPAILASIAQVLASDAAMAAAQGQPPKSDDIHQRYVSMVHQAQQTALRQAQQQAAAAADKIDDILMQGGFYEALADFLVDLPLYPFACIKGPTVRMVPKLTWNGPTPSIQNTPQMFWERVDPFHLYWDPGCTDIDSAEIIEIKKLTRADLNALIGLPGYNQAGIMGALEDYSRGLRDWLDAPDTEAALLRNRESPFMNYSHLIDCAEYHGHIQGRVLLENGVPRETVPDLDRDYLCETWIVGQHVLKTQISPSPRQRHPYYLTSFEKVPGTVAGHGLTDILEDLQEVANATLRALVNNMSIASGPQVVVNTELLDPSTNEDNLYPWKRWKVLSDPLAGSQRPPVDFFQPQSNAQELIGIYTAISGLADDISAIPRYITGESLKGGAGRTASGLSMLMGNAQKVLQTVAANIDSDVVRGILDRLYDMIMLTDRSGLLTGNEQIQVNGVVVALQKETMQQKQLQFLQITGNPIDMQIVGEVGRGRVLRELAEGLGIGDDIVPDDDTIQQQVAQQQAVQAQQLLMESQAGSFGGGGPPPPQQGPPPGAAPSAGAPPGGPPPPLPGARMAPDGQHYIEDPRPGRQGKFLRVDHGGPPPR